MPTTGPMQDMIEEREKAKQEALDILEVYKKNNFTLPRPVFFVSGWTDESCECWGVSYKQNIAIKDWLASICINPYKATYVNFEEESPNCKNFLDFGQVLKQKVWDQIGRNEEFDIVGHSMGGLNIRAAVVQEKELLNIHNCITVATPHQGDNLGGINVWSRNTFLGRLLIGWILHKDTSYHLEQSKGLDPDYEPVKTINTLDKRIAFLERIGKLYEFRGTRDFTVKGSAYLDKTGIPQDICSSKIEDVEIGGADHTGKLGITQDPRTILAIVQIILGMQLEKPSYNHGFI